MRPQKRLPRRRPLGHRRDPLRLQDPRNRRSSHPMPDVLQRPADPRVAPGRDSPPPSAPPAAGSPRARPARPDRPFAYVHFRAISCRCHRRIVSGVTMVATWRNLRRPSRCPRTASRRRSSSLSRRRRPRSCPRRMRFSSIRYARVSCCCRSSQLISAASKHPQEDHVNHGGRVYLTVPRFGLPKLVG